MSNLHADTLYDYSPLFSRHVRKLTEHGDELRGCCLFHDDHNPSWTGNRTTGLWKCHACGAQGNASQFAEKVGERVEEQNGGQNGRQQRKIVAIYGYTDEHGQLLHQAVRFDPKGFLQRRPDSKGGWIWDLKGVRCVPYHLPEILKADTVYIVEGEKDADRLWSLGIPATTNPGGAGKWREEYNVGLAGKHAVIISDNDKPGEQHALHVARSLLPVTATVKIVHLPGLPPVREKHGEDVSDWLDAGHTKEDLEVRVHATLPLQQPDSPHTAGDPLASSNPWILAQDAPAFLAEEEKTFQGLAKDVVYPGAITLLGAPRGLGKTHVGHATGVAIATGGVFRGEQVTPARVLLIDRDNPRAVIKKRLRGWGAAVAPSLHVLTREHAPDLRDKAAWDAFPVTEYDVLIVDSIGSSTEGVTEKEGKQTTEVLATLLNIARRGPAILLLQNTTKDGVNIRGRGEWADRADIVYEVRDATGFTPSGKKPWWQELPEAGEAGWADRAARRKGRIDFRLAFVPSKFRLSVEPEPFCLELYLPSEEPWTLRDVTAELLQAGEKNLAKDKETKDAQRQYAAQALAKRVIERAATGTPILKTEAEEYLQGTQLLSRKEARELLKDSPLWRLESRRQGEGKQAAWCLLPKIDGDGDDSENPPKTGPSEVPFVAVQSESKRQRQVFEESTNDEGSSDMDFVAAENDEEQFSIEDDFWDDAREAYEEGEL